MTNDAETLSTPEQIPEPVKTPRQKMIAYAGWAGFALVCLAVFTVFKLPEDRISAYVQGALSAQLADKGMSLTAAKSSVSMIFGPSITLSDVTLVYPPPQAAVHIDEIKISPSVLPLLIGRVSAKIKLYNGDGKLTAVFSSKGSRLDADLSAKNLDVGKLGIAPFLANGMVNSVAGKITGDVSIAGDLATPATLTGSVHLQLDKVRMEAQQIAGFSIPQINISESRLDAKLDKGKLQIANLKIGKPGGSPVDDLRATVTGDVTLVGSKLDSSMLNLHAQFNLSDNVLKSFSILEALMGNAKQPDGSFAYTITGTMGNPNAVPGGSH